MPFSYFLKIVVVIYLFWYLINLLIDVIKNKTVSGSGKEKETVQLEIADSVEDGSDPQNDKDQSSGNLFATEETVQVNLEMFDIRSAKPLDKIKNISKGSVIADLGLEIISQPGLNLSEMTNQDINDYDFL